VAGGQRDAVGWREQDVGVLAGEGDEGNLIAVLVTVAQELEDDAFRSSHRGPHRRAGVDGKDDRHRRLAGADGLPEVPLVDPRLAAGRGRSHRRGGVDWPSPDAGSVGRERPRLSALGVVLARVPVALAAALSVLSAVGVSRSGARASPIFARCWPGTIGWAVSSSSPSSDDPSDSESRSLESSSELPSPVSAPVSADDRFGDVGWSPLSGRCSGPESSPSTPSNSGSVPSLESSPSAPPSPSPDPSSPPASRSPPSSPSPASGSDSESPPSLPSPSSASLPSDSFLSPSPSSGDSSSNRLNQSSSRSSSSGSSSKGVLRRRWGARTSRPRGYRAR